MEISDAFNALLSDKLLLYAIPIFLLTMVLEFFLSKRKNILNYDAFDTIASLSLGIMYLVVDLFMKLLGFIIFYQLHEISPLKDVVGRQWWAWVLAFLLNDFSVYWSHRISHEVRVLWAGHISHHNTQFMNLGTALRQGFGDPLQKYFFLLWVPLLGFDPLMMFIVMEIGLIYGFTCHTELIHRYPKFIEYVFNTPSHHRVHHGTQVAYLDRNHANALIIWDRMFGTFQEEQDEDWPEYGLTSNIESNNPLRLATHEYAAIWEDVKRADKLSDKLKYIFYAPGWSHDGTDLRSKTLQQQRLADD